MNDEEKMTRFIAEDASRLTNFEHMVDRLCTKTHLDRELLRTYSAQALMDWEAMEDLTVEKLMTMNPVVVKEEINKIVDFFQYYITPVIPDRRKINQSIDIAVRYMQRMFNVVE